MTTRADCRDGLALTTDVVVVGGGAAVAKRLLLRREVWVGRDTTINCDPACVENEKQVL